MFYKAPFAIWLVFRCTPVWQWRLLFSVFLFIFYAYLGGTSHFDQYSRLTICLNIFRFSANNLKTNLKFEKKLSISMWARQDKTIDE